MRIRPLHISAAMGTQCLRWHGLGSRRRSCACKGSTAMQGVFSWCNRKPLLLGSTFACLMVFYLPNRCIVPIEAHNDADTDGDPGYLAQVPGMPLQRHRFTEDQKTRHRYAKDVLADSFSPTDTCPLDLVPVINFLPVLFASRVPKFRPPLSLSDSTRPSDVPPRSFASTDSPSSFITAISLQKAKVKSNLIPASLQATKNNVAVVFIHRAGIP